MLRLDQNTLRFRPQSKELAGRTFHFSVVLTYADKQEKATRVYDAQVQVWGPTIDSAKCTECLAKDGVACLTKGGRSLVSKCCTEMDQQCQQNAMACSTKVGNPAFRQMMCPKEAAICGSSQIQQAKMSGAYAAIASTNFTKGKVCNYLVEFNYRAKVGHLLYLEILELAAATVHVSINTRKDLYSPESVFCSVRKGDVLVAQNPSTFLIAFSSRAQAGAFRFRSRYSAKPIGREFVNAARCSDRGQSVANVPVFHDTFGIKEAIARNATADVPQLIFNSFDTNRDGLASRAEVRAKFLDLNANNNDFISPVEMFNTTWRLVTLFCKESQQSLASGRAIRADCAAELASIKKGCDAEHAKGGAGKGHRGKCHLNF